MLKKRAIKGVGVLISLLLFGCSGATSTLNKEYEKVTNLSQERLFLRDKPFVLSDVYPTIPFPPPKVVTTRSGPVILNALLDVVAPDLIEGSIDLVGESIVELSGKNDETTTIEATISNFFYRDGTYNLTSTKNPAFNLLFISGAFGESVERWRPTGLDSTQVDVFDTLHLVGKPNFYMEAKIFPVPGNQYMEIVPTYIFYNRALNPKGLDKKRDLEIRFSFYDLNNHSNANLISDGAIILHDVQVGREYTQKELADVRTTFMKMPKISDRKKGYSGGYNLKVSVTETRDINEWLASLGEAIEGSKSDISSKLYISNREKIEQETALAKAKIEVQIMEERIKEAKANGASKIEILELESQLLEKRAEANKKAVEFGKAKPY